jgi:chromosome segregation ATPase
MAARALIFSALAALACGTEMQVSANPIRKVVTMLQNMQKQIAKEAESEKELFDKYMCYCKNAGGTLADSIEAAKTKIPQLEAALKGSAGKKAQLEADLKEHKADREAAKKTIKEATAIREREKAAFEKETADDKANVAAIAKALAAIKAGMSGSFVQTEAGIALKRLLQTTQSFAEADRQDVLSFLSGDAQYAPQSGQIVGILATMGDEISADLKKATDAEDAAVKTYDELMAAKTKEIAALSKSIETKLERVAAIGVENAEMANDLEDTKESLAEDEKFLANLDETCKTKKKEWDAIQANRAEELVALADTIKVLNDDDALELFKKTLPSASFMEVQKTSAEMRSRALDLISASRKGSRPGLDFISLALHSKKIGFEKIIQMIEELVTTLKQEQKDDDAKKSYCNEEFDKSDDKKKELERSVSDLETAIADSNEAIAALKAEIKALEAGIKALDKSVAEATEQRKEENAAFKELMANDSAAKEVLAFARNRLNKFYNPKLYKAPPKRELSEEDRITVNMGGTLAATAAPGGIAGTGIEAMVQVKEAPPPPPESFKAYTSKSEESNGVISMINLLVKDLDKEMTTAQAEEKDAQNAYETAMKDAADKRVQDSKSLSDKEGAKADMESALQQQTDEKKATEKELAATLQYIHNLHGECDWLLQYFDARTEARAGEVNSLENAKAVLSGADYSLAETSRRTYLRMR